jgi:hypothetical protein
MIYQRLVFDTCDSTSAQRFDLSAQVFEAAADTLGKSI